MKPKTPQPPCHSGRGTLARDESLELATIRTRLATARGRDYWRSLEEAAGAPGFQEFLHREFPAQASEFVDPVGRRTFLKLMGASLALAGATACTTQPPETIIPYVRQPEDIIPGKPLYFATAMALGGTATGLLVESNMGRPTKIEGNPDHPGSLGATDSFAQASVLTLYDPDRSQTLTYLGEIRPWSAFIGAVRSALDVKKSRQGAGFRILTEAVASPTLIDQLQQLLKAYPAARWHRYEPLGADHVREGARLAFGQAVDVQYRFDRADVIVSLDADFLECEPGSVRHVRDFSSRRRVSHSSHAMNRLYVLESMPTTTGGKADHRWALRSSQVEAYARRLAAQLGIGGASGSTDTGGAAGKAVPAIARDLEHHRGRSLVLAGAHQPPAVHALAHAMNQALGNAGQTVFYTEPLDAVPAGHFESLRELVRDMDAGQVDLLLVLGGNPVYNAPADLEFGDRLSKVALRIHAGLYDDETSALCHWHIPETHYLESWSDARGRDGTVSIVQPLIAPLYGGKSAHEVLAAFTDRPERASYDIVREYWLARLGARLATGSVGVAPGGSTGHPRQLRTAPQHVPETFGAGSRNNHTPALPAGSRVESGLEEQAGGATQEGAAPPNQRPDSPFERLWRKALHDGVMPDTAARPVAIAARTIAPASASSAPARSEEGLEVVFRPDPTIYDGRFANNGWLQELPKSLTRLTWDNAAIISPRTAERLGLGARLSFQGGAHGQTVVDVVELRHQGRAVRAPIWILPGHADDCVTVHLGYGRTRAGRVGTGAGFNAFAIRRSDSPWITTGVELRKTGDKYSLACVQAHHSMEGRELVRSATLEEFEREPDFAKERREAPPRTLTLYPDVKYDGYAWGMAIDLNTCVGCNACVVACQSENNIPVVGKEQVLRGREMHWLRVDRYFKGDLDNPEIYNQPVPCMHCENAPCEVVCPVGATVHSTEGLNDMVYNRCVGTRYCSNNCPYKVRRFNFLLYQDWSTPSLEMVRNPDVTVRSRGVMEKCSYCVQRINDAKIEAEKENRPVRDGEIVTACQGVCPAEAIVFGNINDPASRVSRLKAESRNYGLLAELNTRPRTTYLAAIRNPNSEIESDATDREAGVHRG